jgi:hypothetical protein
MMTDGSPDRLCHYGCGRLAGSEEHLPGSAALNDTPVTINYLRTGDGKIKTVRRREEDGFIVRTICEPCNRHTGGSYGTAFKKFVHAFAESGRFFTPDQGRALISAREIQPLRVLKQMAGMVLAAQSEAPVESLKPLQQFVRRQWSKLPDEAGTFYLYRNVSPRGRVASMTGFTFLRVRAGGPLMVSEVSWPPLGLVYVLGGPHLMLEKMTNVTGWGRYDFRDVTSLHFSVPQFRIEVNSPLAFGSPAEHEAWETRVGRIQLLWGNHGGETPTQISSLVQRDRPKRK